MGSIKLTQEQLDVINFDIKEGEVLVVEAGAGTGKTTCFIEFAKNKPMEKILYLCFNNKSAAEAKKLYAQAGVKNTTASTIHGLASKVKKEFTRYGKFQERVSPKDLERSLHIGVNISCLILKTIKNFCESADREIKSCHIPALPPNFRQTEVSREDNPSEDKHLEKEILTMSKRVWSMMLDKKNPMPISYDHYLKIFQLSEPDLKYCYLLLDEAQDSNPVTLAILESQKRRTKTILIGDKNQAIYGWRGAEDAMGRYEQTSSLSLTHSFRFGKNIAKVANKIVEKYQGEKGRLKGVKEFDLIKVTANVLRPPQTNSSSSSRKPLEAKTFIARTNATLFDKALELANMGEKYHFHGTTKENNWDPSNLYKLNDLKDVYHMWSSNPQRVVNPYIKMYGTYKSLKEAAFGINNFQLANRSQETKDAGGAGKNGDTELQFLCRLVEKYKHLTPSVTQTLKENCVGPPEEQTINDSSNLTSAQTNLQKNDVAVITLTTAHRAKGLEWENVEIADDFLKNIENLDKKAAREEYNLLYVAVTRAKKELGLPPSLSHLHLDLEKHSTKEKNLKGQKSPNQELDLS
jgi:superfamily I DNA/RNA helicase